MDLSVWLRDLGLERYTAAFTAHDVDADVLPKLTAEDLIAIGITSVGHRRKLLEAIDQLRLPADMAEPASTPEIPADTPRETRPAAAPPARDAERRQLTVLFCDLVGSTALSGEFDPEDMSTLIRVYQDVVAGVTLRFEGHVAKFMGDGVLAYFGWPQAHEDDAERAVRAGLAIAKVVSDLKGPNGAAMAARIGVATGLVVVGELVGEGAAQERAVVGETPNLAARLQALADPGAVVISQATRRLAGGLFELTDLGPQRLKGFAEPLAAFRVEGEGRADGRFEALHGQHLTPLIGRDHELAMLLERWAWAKDGDGQVVLIAGEAGIGKSRMLTVLRQRLSGEPHLALSHFCSPYHTNSSLHPIITQLERAAGFASNDAAADKLAKLETLLGRASSQLDEAVPLIAALLGIPPDARHPALNLSPPRQKQRTLEVLIEQLAGLARDRPVLELYEDLHWVDPSTLELLDLLVERVRALPVLLVLTHRHEFSPTWSGHAHVTALTMNRLGRREGAVLVDRLTGGKVLPVEVLDQILAKTDGVPLFVEELTKTVLDSGLLADAGDHYELSSPLPPLAIPTTLHDSLMARLDRLASVKEIAQTAAVIGREFSHPLLAAVADRPETDLEAALDQLVSAGLIFRRGIPPEATYSFKHALVRDAAYQSLLKSKREQLHARLAKVLEDELRQTDAGILAHHYHAAGLLEDAIPYAIRAGDAAFARFAFVEARARYQEAADMAQALAPAEQASRLQIRAMLKLAHIYQLLGEFGHLPPKEVYPKAKSAATRALELDPANAEAHYVLALISGLYDWDWKHSESAYKTAIELDPHSVRAHHDYGILLLTPLGRHEEALSELEQAVELDPLISWTGADLASALNLARRHESALAQSLSVIERDPMCSHAYRHLGLAYLKLGKSAQALVALKRAVELTGGEAFAVAQLGWAYGMVGDQDEARKALHDLQSRARREHVDPLAFAWLCIGLGDMAAAFSWLERAYEARSSWLIFLKVHPIYEPVHADPRYHDLLRRLGLSS